MSVFDLQGASFDMALDTIVRQQHTINRLKEFITGIRDDTGRSPEERLVCAAILEYLNQLEKEQYSNV